MWIIWFIVYWAIVISGIVLGLSAWNDLQYFFETGTHLEDARYLNWFFWVIELLAAGAVLFPFGFFVESLFRNNLASKLKAARETTPYLREQVEEIVTHRNNELAKGREDPFPDLAPEYGSYDKETGQLIITRGGETYQQWKERIKEEEQVIIDLHNRYG